MSKKRKQFRKGMVVRVKFLDHVEDGSEPEEFIVFGQIAEVNRKYICVDSWKYANNGISYDDNVKRFTLLRSTILEWKKLIEEPDNGNSDATRTNKGRIDKGGNSNTEDPCETKELVHESIGECSEGIAPCMDSLEQQFDQTVDSERSLDDLHD
jgi:hypothetical protein